MRDILETAFLLDLFSRDAASIRRYRCAEEKERRDCFRPMTVRKALEQRDGKHGRWRHSMHQHGHRPDRTAWRTPDRGPVVEERLGLLVDRELIERHSRQLTNRLRRARLRHAACVEDIDFRQPRGLDKALVLSLADGRWIRDRLNFLITGPAGVGKTWIACTLTHSACRMGYSASYRRLPRRC